MVKNRAAKQAARRIKTASGITYPRALDQVRRPALTHDSLGLPEAVRGFIGGPGLYIVSGPTGSGKTSTTASLLHQMRGKTICTVESLLELGGSAPHSRMMQFEVGRDVSTFAAGIERAMGEPGVDVIVAAELFTSEDILAAIEAAAGGCIVLVNMHMTRTAAAPERIVGAFPGNEAARTRVMLSHVLKKALVQKLVPGLGGRSMVPAVEVLDVNPEVAGMILQGDSEGIAEGLRFSGADYETSLARLLLAGKISTSTVQAEAAYVA